MLTVLRVIDKARPGRWRFRRRAASVWSEEAGEGACVYRLVTVARYPGEGVDWAGVAAHAGADAARILPAGGLLLPEGAAVYGVRAFAGRGLTAVLMQRALWTLLRQWRLPARELSVGLLDPAGLYGRLALALLPRAWDVRVATSADGQTAYRDTARQAMAVYGASLPVSADPEGLRGVRVLIAPGGIGGAPGAACMLSGVPTPRRGVIDGYFPANAAAWLAAKPPDVAAQTFLAAAYECADGKAATLGASPPELVRIDGSWSALDAVGRRLLFGQAVAK